MAKQLRNTASGTQGVQRILRQQTGQALDVLRESQLPSDESVHEVRKQLKKVRATRRLLREVLGSKFVDRLQEYWRHWREQV